MEVDYSDGVKYQESGSDLEGFDRLEKLSLFLPLRKELKGHLVDSAP